ncbi:hypothetical protein BCR36DRAFT_581809 [Piromyces finnis]|uniref:Uncharacterized protein n=1 Tax=Piromyces finnis TaxID=1754191 RepID=A0A1Y1VFF2_9FUNG|nr:hypothetical protein BCR36DRAFT_581809 [Piromyces finnis]|eukprot:ORX54172.1 hypothetical protein BCR36DRAFT_581809 [Piromyces finnis]
MSSNTGSEQQLAISIMLVLVWIITKEYLISNYIKNIDTTSPIANYNVTYNQNWMYTGIINKTKDVEYINFRYFQDPTFPPNTKY